MGAGEMDEGVRRAAAGAAGGSAARARANAREVRRRARGRRAVCPQSREAAGCTARFGRAAPRPPQPRVPRPAPGSRRRPAAPGRSSPAIARTRRSL